METKNEVQIYNKKPNNNQLTSIIINKKRIINENANSSSTRYKQEMMDTTICFSKIILFKIIYSRIKTGLFNIKNYFKERQISNFKINLNHEGNK